MPRNYLYTSVCVVCVCVATTTFTIYISNMIGIHMAHQKYCTYALPNSIWDTYVVVYRLCIMQSIVYIVYTHHNHVYIIFVHKVTHVCVYN